MKKISILLPVLLVSFALSAQIDLVIDINKAKVIESSDPRDFLKQVTGYILKQKQKKGAGSGKQMAQQAEQSW